MGSRLEAYLSWYILLLDAQAGLASHPEAGHCTCVILERGRSLPLWPSSPSQRKVFSTSESEGKFLQVHKLSLTTFEMFAEQSQTSLDLRRASRERHVGLEERQQHIRDLSIRHVTLWEESLSSLTKVQQSKTSKSLASRIVASTHNFARIQYSVLQLQLHTSMYPHQRLDSN